jgi:hypothetical protein
VNRSSKTSVVKPARSIPQKKRFHHAPGNAIDKNGIDQVNQQIRQVIAERFDSIQGGVQGKRHLQEPAIKISPYEKIQAE